MFDAEGADTLEFFFGEDLADGIVAAGVSRLPSSDIAETLRGVQNLTQVRSQANVRLGVHTIILVLGLIAFSSSSKSIVHSEAGEVLVAPSLGGWRGT